jgi:hypothetical protein
MSEPERLKQLLKEAKDDMDKLDDWMKSQEPAPGVSYEDWGKQETEKNETNKAGYFVSFTDSAGRTYKLLKTKDLASP